ncbi:DUF2795 domain-containing protein [Streptomyces sp. NPDC056628]|uniref:DUF2795 domain-containing protein n=1 Tax=Streptomyces sp. NPDC056628 TaxID=3345882 RepID=UPI0036BAD2ED
MLDALQDVDFPAGKEELVKAATNAGTPEEMVKALHAIPSVEYGNRDDGRVGARRPCIRPGPSQRKPGMWRSRRETGLRSRRPGRAASVRPPPGTQASPPAAFVHRPVPGSDGSPRGSGHPAATRRPRCRGGGRRPVAGGSGRRTGERPPADPAGRHPGGR